MSTADKYRYIILSVLNGFVLYRQNKIEKDLISMAEQNPNEAKSIPKDVQRVLYNLNEEDKEFLRKVVSEKGKINDDMLNNIVGGKYNRTKLSKNVNGILGFISAGALSLISLVPIIYGVCFLFDNNNNN